jgi:ribosomal protein S4E
VTSTGDGLAEPLADGDFCRVVAGRHVGKAGTVEDRHTSASGNVTITVRLANGDRIKTLARNVTVAAS